MNSVCGGKGTCGKCRVIVGGKVDSDRTPAISDGEWGAGVRLACRSIVVEDVVVTIPEEAQVAAYQILTTHPVTEVTDLSPLCTAHYLELPHPTLEDNIGDLERLGRGLGLRHGELVGSLLSLKSLPLVLRAADWKVTAFIDQTRKPRVLLGTDGGDRTDRNFGIALDIGTTTVVMTLVRLSDGKTVAQASAYNRQIACGEDVLSRIAFAEEGGLERLNVLVLETIDVLISDVCANSAASLGVGQEAEREDMTCVSIAGNTTMIHLLLRLDPRSIRYEPYIPIVNVPPVLRSEEVGIRINPQAPVYCMPGRSGYVGGDITADVIAAGMHKSSDLSLLIDVGTNGEVVLGHKDWMVSCSCSAGPAFEGGEVAAGMRAMEGAIERVRILGADDVAYSTIGGKRPRGICGSGLIDLLAEMFLRDIVDKKGRIMESSSKRARRGEDGMEFVVVPASERAGGSGPLRRDIVVTDNDIANIIRTKGAVYAACSVLLKSLKLDFSDVRQVHVAGGFGNYIDTERAIVIGLLPDVPFDRFNFIGNGALAGARLALLSEGSRAEARSVYESMTYFELSTTQLFFEEFSSALFLPHTDIERFPTVRRLLDE